MGSSRQPRVSEDGWERIKAQMPPGTVVSGRVLSVHQFGFFVDIGQGPEVRGLVEVVADPGEPNIYPPVGTWIPAAVVLYFTPYPTLEVFLSTRPSDLAQAG